MDRQQANEQINMWERGLAIFYAIFFVAQILSPSIHERTIYLEWIVMLFNPFFWRWLLPINFNYKRGGIVILLLSMVVLGHPMTAVKIFLNIYSALVLVYLFEKKLWYINVTLYVSIGVAVLQLIFMAIDVEMAYMLGPQNVSNMLWGSYATQTNTNLYDALGIGFPRASGLSREAGFLASLIVVAIIHIVVEARSINIWKKMIYLLGYIVSFSKMSFVLIAAYVVVKLGKYINKVSMLIWVLIFLTFMLTYWSGETDWLNENGNITFLSRFGGYDAMWYLEPHQLFFGEDELNKIDGLSAINEYYGENLFAGLGGWIIYNGLLLFLAFIGILNLLEFKSTGVILLLLLTINVQPDTNQNFVVYA